MKRNLRACLAALVVVLGGLVTTGSPRIVHAATYTVTSSASSGPGSLRAAVLAANAASDTAPVIEIDSSVVSTITVSDPCLTTYTVPFGTLAINVVGSNPVSIVASGCLYSTAGLLATSSYSGVSINTNGGPVLTIRGFGSTNMSAGGAIVSRGATTIRNAVFVGNTSGSNGGALFVDGPLTITDSVFEGNGPANGGAIANSDRFVNRFTRVTFRNNFAIGNGGAVYGGEFIITDSLFEGNQSGGYGGAVFSDKIVTVVNSTFTNNNAVTSIYGSGGGGAIFSDGSIDATGVTATGNTSIREGGGAFMSWRDTTVRDSLFQDNHTVGAGGAVYSMTGGVVASGTRFVGNSATTAGGAVSGRSTNSAVRGSTFDTNTAADGAGFFGAGVVEDSTFTGNHASNDGGAIANPGGTLVMQRNSLVGNIADHAGGGIAISGQLYLGNTTLAGNSSPIGAAVAVNDDATADLTLSTIADHAAVPAIWSAGTAITTLAGVALADNAGGNCATAVSSVGDNWADDASCGLAATGDVEAPGAARPFEPALAINGATNGTLSFLPVAGGPLLAGVTSNCNATFDQRNGARPLGFGCDIGAVELDDPTPPTTTTTTTTTTTEPSTTSTTSTTVEPGTTSTTLVDVGGPTTTTPTTTTLKPPAPTVAPPHGGGHLPVTGGGLGDHLMAIVALVGTGALFVGIARRRRAPTSS